MGKSFAELLKIDAINDAPVTEGRIYGASFSRLVPLGHRVTQLKTLYGMRT
jgi:hypothetical protein